MLEAKLAGQEIKVPEPVEEETPVVDLMEALKASVSEAQKKKPAAKKAKGSSSSGTRKKAAAGRRS
jgi:DNA end-binding protein Ku